MFESAIRNKYRFKTVKGMATTEDLYDMELIRSDGFDLNTVARYINSLIKEQAEESFVETKTVTNTTLNNQFAIVKHIIAVKLEEKAARETAAERKVQKQKIMEAIANAQDKDLEGKSVAQLTKMLEKL